MATTSPKLSPAAPRAGSTLRREPQERATGRRSEQVRVGTRANGPAASVLFSAPAFASLRGYYESAENWQRRYRESENGSVDGVISLERRDACLREAHKLARKALRRMEWRLW